MFSTFCQSLEYWEVVWTPRVNVNCLVGRRRREMVRSPWACSWHCWGTTGPFFWLVWCIHILLTLNYILLLLILQGGNGKLFWEHLFANKWTLCVWVKHSILHEASHMLEWAGSFCASVKWVCSLPCVQLLALGCHYVVVSVACQNCGDNVWGQSLIGCRTPSKLFTWNSLTSFVRWV